MSRVYVLDRIGESPIMATADFVEALKTGALISLESPPGYGIDVNIWEDGERIGHFAIPGQKKVLSHAEAKARDKESFKGFQHHLSSKPDFELEKALNSAFKPDDQ